MSNIIRTRFIGEFGTDTYMVTPAYFSSLELGDSNAVDIAADILTHWQAFFNAVTNLQVPPWVWTVLELMKIDETTGEEQKVIAVPINEVGTAAGNALPSFSAALLSLPVLGNARNAKMFLMAFSEFDSLGQGWDAAQLAVLTALAGIWADGFTGALSGSTFSPGMWSPTNLVFHTGSGGGIADALISHQVRRKIGRGQ